MQWRYLRQVAPGTFAVDDSLRRHASWHVEDAVRAAPRPAWDIILCRNLMIYLMPSSAEALWQRLYESLAPEASW